MPHVLDRPIWHALHSRQSAHAEGGSRALRYASDVAPFAAAVNDGAEALAELAGIVPPDGSVMLLQAGKSPLPPGTIALMTAAGVQRVAGSQAFASRAENILDLKETDAPEMRALAALAKPGPFLPRAHLLGGFVGIREQGRLVAMAGERMKLPGFIEVSGVCTDPGFRGRGYAGLLSRVVAARIVARGETPFLHAFATNTGAIRLYEQLGFERRSDMTCTALGRA